MKKLFFPLFFLFCLVSCATRITTPVTRPAELDLNGAKTVAVLPFQPNPWKNNTVDILEFFFSPFSGTVDKRLFCENMTERLTMMVLDSNYFQVVNASSVQAALERGFVPPCDVYITGYIQNYDENIIVHQHEEKRPQNPKPAPAPSPAPGPGSGIRPGSEPGPRPGPAPNGKPKLKSPPKSPTHHPVPPPPVIEPPEIRTTYSKDVHATIVYQIIDARSNRIISNQTKSISGSSGEYSRKSELPSGYSLIKYNIQSIVNEIKHKIQPYVVSVSFKLLSDKTKDPEIQAAHEMAKNHRLNEAKDMFISCYNRTRSFECYYNAAILLEAMQRYDEAEEMMQKLYNETFDTRAEKALYDIRREKYYASRLNDQESARSENNF